MGSAQCFRWYEFEIKRTSFDRSLCDAGARRRALISTRLSFVGLYYRFLNRIRYLRPVRYALCVWTHVMAPGNLVNPGIGLDVAFEVNVDTLPNSTRIQIAAKLEGNHRLVWKQNRHQSWSARNLPIWETYATLIIVIDIISV